MIDAQVLVITCGSVAAIWLGSRPQYRGLLVFLWFGAVELWIKVALLLGVYRPDGHTKRYLDPGYWAVILALPAVLLVLVAALVLVAKLSTKLVIWLAVFVRGDD